MKPGFYLSPDGAQIVELIRADRLSILTGFLIVVTLNGVTNEVGWVLNEEPFKNWELLE